MDPQRELDTAWNAVHDVLVALLASNLFDGEEAWIRECVQDALVWLIDFDPKDRVIIYLYST